MSIRVVRETHEAPEPLQRQVARAGGLNRFGEPNYRVVWGWSRLSLIGGKWADYDAHGNLLAERIEMREVPKYLPTNRWHLERWMPPESYGSPKQWYAQTIEREDGILIPALGPYPRRGEYEHCFTLQSPHGEFLGLTPAACEHIVRAVEFSRTQNAWLMKLALRKREEDEAKAWDARADAILNDATPAFDGHTFVTAPRTTERQ